jgi:hypothetical protein
MHVPGLCLDDYLRIVDNILAVGDSLQLHGQRTESQLLSRMASIAAFASRSVQPVRLR